MDLELDDDLLELRQAATGALDRHAPLSLARQYLDGTGSAELLWRQISELGWFGIGLDEDDPFGVPGLCLLAEQIGRHAAPTTLIDAVVAARVAQAAGSDWAQRFAEGEELVALALLEPGASWLSQPLTAVSRQGEELILSGEKTGVHHALSVGRLAVIAEYEGAPALVIVPIDRAGVELKALAGIDPACAPCRVSVEHVVLEEHELLCGPEVEAELRTALDVAAVASTAEALGAASAALELSIAYSLERVQYGRQIGSFQALQHLIAEQHCLRETAWASVLYASAALQEGTEDAPAATAVAKSHGATAAKLVAEGALQVFGGVGFTREHDFHLLYRRALEAAGRFGDGLAHERRLAEILFDTSPALA